MKRFVNFRQQVLIACLLALGILAGFIFAFYGFEILYGLIVIPFAAIIIIILFLLHKTAPLVITIILTAVFTGGLFYAYFAIQSYDTDEIKTTETVYISATVLEKSQTDYGEYIILENVKVNGKSIRGKVQANLSSSYGEFCDVGYKVEFYSALQKYDAFNYGNLNYLVQEDIRYRCSVYGDLKSDYRFSLFAAIRTAIRQTLFENVDRDTAAICYAMLIGDTTYMSDESLDNFRYGGIAHIFAVSGLHIGIIFLIIGLILKPIKPNKYVSAAIRIGLIIFYSGICGFTVSSVRAVIMCTVSIIAGLIYCKNDSLNSLATSAFLILLIKPLSLFSVGFQHSICAVGGINIFSRQINNLLKKVRVPQKISSSVGTAVGAQLGTMPIMLSSFGYVSGVGLLLNIVFVPVISILFILLFGGTIISAIVPLIATFVVPTVVLPIQALLSFLLSTGFDSAVVTGLGSVWFAVIYFVLIFIISDKINLTAVFRLISSSTMIIVLSLYVVFMTFAPFNTLNISISANNFGGSVILKSSQGTVLVTTDTMNNAKFLNENYSVFLDGVIVLGNEECVLDYDQSLRCSNVYVSNLYFPAQPFKTAVVHYEKDFKLCGINFEFVDGYSLIVEYNGVSICICAGETIPFTKCDLLISKYANTVCNTKQNVYFSLKGYKNNVYDCGNINYSVNDGKLYLNGIIPNR